MDFAASPERVARAILRGIARRAAVINGVPWQSALTALGEFSGSLADPFIIGGFTTRSSSTEAASPSAPSSVVEAVQCHPERSPEGTESKDRSFDLALAPVARRMERVKLTQEFLRTALVPGATLELASACNALGRNAE